MNPYYGYQQNPAIPSYGSPSPMPTPGSHNPGYPQASMEQPWGYQQNPSLPSFGNPSPMPTPANQNLGYPQGNTQNSVPQGFGYPGYPNPGSQPNMQQCNQTPSTVVIINGGHGQAPQYPQVPAVPPFLQSKPTVLAANPFDPLDDAKVLRKAMKGFGTNEKAIIGVLTRRTNVQRLRIATEYKSAHGRDLTADLKSETSGNFKKLLVALVTSLPEFYARELHDAIAGLGTDEDILIEIMCTLNNLEIHAIKQAYNSTYKKTLEEDIRGDTSGYFRKLLVALCQENRSQDYNVNQEKAKTDARNLHIAGVKRLGTDEAAFISIFCTNSFPQLAEIFNEYQSLAGHSMEEAIKAEFSGDIKNGLLTIVKVVRNKAAYFAELLHKSMKGLGTNDSQLIRVIRTRCEIDLDDIKTEFQKLYKESLRSWIEGDTSGHYKKTLLWLLGDSF